MLTPDEWARIGPVLDGALERPPSERDAFVRQACGDDAALLREVARLLHCGELAEGSVLERPAVELGAPLLEQPDAVVLGRYELVRRLGAGGMGVVFLARDQELDRPVALKFLAPHVAAGADAIARFRTEARAASALDHPRIAAVHDIGEDEDGRPFIVMGYYEGETLRERIARGPLAVPEACTLAAEVAEGLSAAHATGIVHRDIKPSNILLTTDGARILDFGIAKSIDADVTRQGTRLGSVAYMSPEQTRGDAVDHRTDLWSLGVVLYEMLAGRRPFRGESDATLIHAIRNDELEPVTNLRPDVPPTVATILEACLSKDASARFARATDVVAELAAPDAAGSAATPRQRDSSEGRRPESAGNRSRWQALRRREAAGNLKADDGGPGFSVESSFARGRIRRPRSIRRLMGAIVVFSLLSAAAGASLLLTRGETTRPPYAGEPAALAVLPFQVSGGGLEEWEEGMAVLLATGLDGAAGLRAVDSRTVLSRWNRALDGGRAADLATGLRIAAATGARFALEGSAVSLGDEVRLAASVHDLDRGTQVGSVHVEGSLDSPTALADGLGIEVLRMLFGGTVSEFPRVNLAAVTTNSTEALRAYLRGERSYRAGRFEDAVNAYEDAVAIDSTFALAYYRLSLGANWIGLAGSALQQRYHARALELADKLPERERLLVLGTYRMTRSETDPARLETTLGQAVDRYPLDAEAWYLLAETFFHAPSLIMSPFEIEALFARANKLDPGFAPYRIHHIEYAFLLHGDSAMAADRIGAYRAAADPADPILAGSELLVTLLFGDSLARATVLETLRGYDGTNPVLNVLSWGPLHPRLLSRQEALLRFALEEVHGLPIELLGLALGRNLAAQGRYAEALEIARLEGLSGSQEEICLLSELMLFGYSVPGEVVGSTIEDQRSARTPGAALCKALLATDLGARSVFDEQREQLLTLAQEADDGTTRQWLEALVRLAGVYWAWRQEDASAEGVRRLTTEAGPDRSIWLPNWRYWLGEMYRELGQPRKAEQAYLASLLWENGGRPTVHAWYHLAGIYDELGDQERARDAWQRVLVAWENADRELQPRVEEARARLAVLD